jgi:20S proteasome subunit beta 4
VIRVCEAFEDLYRWLNADAMLTTMKVQFAEFIQANIQLYTMRNNMELSPAATANFVRGELAQALRSRKPYTVNLLLGGYDEIADRPTLYWIDYLASLAPVPYAAHGYAQYVMHISCLRQDSVYMSDQANALIYRYYCLSLLDKHHHPDIDYEQGMKIMRMCTEELKRRLPIDFKGVFIKVITKDGVKDVDYEDDANISVP